jgi:hypothetical protein
MCQQDVYTGFANRTNGGGLQVASVLLPMKKGWGREIVWSRIVHDYVSIWPAAGSFRPCGRFMLSDARYGPKKRAACKNQQKQNISQIPAGLTAEYERWPVTAVSLW